MSSERLRDTFALLLRENHGQHAALSADAAREIRKRVALRWAAAAGALAAVCGVGTAAVLGAYGGGSGGESATNKPIPTPTIGVALATFPVEGGPEFESAAADINCGDPAPAPRPTAHNTTLSIKETKEVVEGEIAHSYDDLPTVEPLLAQTPETDLGVLSSSAVSVIIERDGIVVGMQTTAIVSLGWNQLGVAANQGLFSGPLAPDWIYCPDEEGISRSSLEPGTYDVVAITRVFSTPESVALYQELGLASGTWNLDPANLDPAAIYLPGSYDCAQTIAETAPARGCLPDFTPDAKLDAAAGTITMRYDTKDLVEEFSSVLVSDPVSAYIPAFEPLSPTVDPGVEALGPFDSIDDFTCGASASYNALDQETRTEIATSLYEASAGPVLEGGPFRAQVLANGIPDGSRVSLLEGARLVYLFDTFVTDTGGNFSSGFQTVVGTSALRAASPITTDRFAGPQIASLISEPMTACPGVDLTAATESASFVLVGTWRIVTPDGTETTRDVASSLWYWGLGG